VVKAGEPARLVCTACGFIFYLDPKLATGAVFSFNGGIVLVRRAIEPSYGKWVFPGGYVDRGETLEGATVREAREESGLDVRLVRILGAYSYPGNPVILIVFLGEVTGGSLRIDDESLEIRAFPPAHIPWDDLAFPSTRAALQDYLALTGGLRFQAPLTP
jgi:ADP-ribose pyrophosphatase YjhB (NUDIX family)